MKFFVLVGGEGATLLPMPLEGGGLGGGRASSPNLSLSTEEALGVDDVEVLRGVAALRFGGVELLRGVAGAAALAVADAPTTPDPW